MQDALNILTDPADNWPWLLALILVVSAGGSLVIILSAKFAMQGMAKEAARAITQLTRTPVPTESKPSIITVGEGLSRWRPGAFTMFLQRREAAADIDSAYSAGEAAIERLSLHLVDHLGENGLAETDITGKTSASGAADGGCAATVEVQVVLMDPSLQPKVAQRALAIGFTENRRGQREEVTLDDAHERAGRLAFDEATINMRAAAASLSRAEKVSFEDMALVDVKIESVASLPGEDIRKRATLGWRSTAAASAA